MVPELFHLEYMMKKDLYFQYAIGGNHSVSSTEGQWGKALSPFFKVQTKINPHPPPENQAETCTTDGMTILCLEIHQEVLLQSQINASLQENASAVLVYTEQGSAELFTCSQNIKINCGEILIIENSQPFILRADTCQLRLVIFNLQLISAIYPLIKMTRIMQFNHNNNKAELLQHFIRDELDRFLNLQSSGYTIRQETASHILRLMVQDQYLAKIRNSHEKTMAVQKYLAENIFQPNITAATLCKELDISAYELQKIMQPHGGLKQYINKARIEEFCRKLHEGVGDSYNLYDLSLDLGFRSESAFRRIFKSVTGVVPSKFLSDIHNRINPSPGHSE